MEGQLRTRFGLPKGKRSARGRLVENRLPQGLWKPIEIELTTGIEGQIERRHQGPAARTELIRRYRELDSAIESLLLGAQEIQADLPRMIRRRFLALGKSLGQFLSEGQSGTVNPGLDRCLLETQDVGNLRQGQLGDVLQKQR